LGVARGKTGSLEGALTIVSIGWLFTPLVNTKAGITMNGLLHLPIPRMQLFSIKLLSLLVPPYGWMVAAGSLIVCYPLSQGPKPIIGTMGGLLFTGSCCLTGVTIAQLMSVSSWRKLLGFLLAIFAILSALQVTISHVHLDLLLTFSPVAIAAQTALGNGSWRGIGLLAGLTAVAYFAALWSFQQSLESSSNRHSRKIVVLNPFIFLGRIGAFLTKDLRYFRRLLDPYFGLLASALCSWYLSSAQVPSIEVLTRFIVIIFAPNASLVFNCFGLDNRSALDRYSLLPLSGKTIIAGKNLAYVLIMSVEILPVVILGAWRLGFWAASLCLAEAALLALAYMTWGNWIAIKHAFKMQFFRVASGGSVIHAIAGLAFGSLPGVFLISLSKAGETLNWMLITLVFLFYGALYLNSVQRGGMDFDLRPDSFREFINS